MDGLIGTVAVVGYIALVCLLASQMLLALVPIANLVGLWMLAVKP